ncbi:MAG: LemA family protein [Thermoleophilaceae bacterium]|nr:LemA family protein [Thermoleophilaceae bacterium]
MSLPAFAGAAAVVIVVWAVYTYNYLIHARAKVREGFSGVDVQRRLRHDLVPNLCEAVRGSVVHENETLRAAAARRSKAIAASRPQDVEAAENSLAEGLSRLLALAERYPQLKSSEQFTKLAAELIATEDEIQAARAIYNANVEFYNTRAQRLPTSLVASWMKPRSFKYLRLEPIDVAKAVPPVGVFAA